MDIKYSHEKARQSIQGNLINYESVAISMAIAFELEDFMKERGISKMELADAAGISLSYLNQIFSGNRLINIKMLAGISQKYQVRFDFKIQDARKALNDKLIDQFLEILRKEYPKTIFKCEYQDDDGWYKVWHTHENALDSNEFNEFVGKCIKDFLMPEGVHKVYFDFVEQIEI